MKEGRIELVVRDYLLEKLTDEIKDEFVNAAIHFNINEYVYDKYRKLRVECILNSVKSEKTMDYIELSSVYGYIIFRGIQNNEFDKEDVIEALQIILSIKNSLTRYVTKTISEENLFKRLKLSINKMGVTEEFNNEIINML